MREFFHYGQYLHILVSKLIDGTIDSSNRLELVLHTFHIETVVSKHFTHEVFIVNPHIFACFSVFKVFPRIASIIQFTTESLEHYSTKNNNKIRFTSITIFSP